MSVVMLLLPLYAFMSWARRNLHFCCGSHFLHVINFRCGFNQYVFLTFSSFALLLLCSIFLSQFEHNATLANLRPIL
jgi:hypothetical protein